MARLPALVKAIADHDDRPSTMIGHFARVLRDERLIVSDTAGLGAPDMTYADAATLLMATLGAATPAGARTAVANLRQLTAWGDNHVQLERDYGPLAAVVGKDFSETLTFMIRNADEISGWHQRYLDRDGGGIRPSAAGTLGPMLGNPISYRPVTITCHNDGYLAEVALGRFAGSTPFTFHEFYRPGPHADVNSTAERRECVGLRVVGAQVLNALKNAVDAPNPARTWSRGARQNKM